MTMTVKLMMLMSKIAQKEASISMWHYQSEFLRMEDSQGTSLWTSW
jgi:hypothetical protein